MDGWMDEWMDGWMDEVLWSVYLRYCSGRKVYRYVGRCVGRKIDCKRKRRRVLKISHLTFTR
jgi:hypothetical protein